MRGTAAKKLRKYTNQGYSKYYTDMCTMPFWNRLLYCKAVIRREKLTFHIK